MHKDQIANELNVRLGSLLAEFRRERNLTQEELVNNINNRFPDVRWFPSDVSRLESGKKFATPWYLFLYVCGLQLTDSDSVQDRLAEVYRQVVDAHLG